MSIAVILGIIASVLTIIIMWMQGSGNRGKVRIWAEFKGIEAAYRKALAEGNPQMVSQLSKQMQEMRDKYKYLGGSK